MNRDQGKISYCQLKYIQIVTKIKTPAHTLAHTHSQSQLHSFLIPSASSLSLSYARLMRKEGLWSDHNCFERVFCLSLTVCLGHFHAQPCPAGSGLEPSGSSCVQLRAVPAPPHRALLQTLWPTPGMGSQYNNTT